MIFDIHSPILTAERVDGQIVSLSDVANSSKMYRVQAFQSA